MRRAALVLAAVSFLAWLVHRRVERGPQRRVLFTRRVGSPHSHMIGAGTRLIDSSALLEMLTSAIEGGEEEREHGVRVRVVATDAEAAMAYEPSNKGGPRAAVVAGAPTVVRGGQVLDVAIGPSWLLGAHKQLLRRKAKKSEATKWMNENGACLLHALCSAAYLS